MEKETVGKIASELMQKEAPSNDPILLQRHMQEDYLNNLLLALEDGKKKYPNSDFFIVVITKNERLMQNVFRNYFFFRLTCPTPDYDQAVYRYDYKNELVEFIWVIPSRDASFHLKENALRIAPEEKGLLKFILEFADGTLYKLAKKLNGEKEDSILLEKE